MKEPSPDFQGSTQFEKQAAKWIACIDRGLTSTEQDEYVEWLTKDERHRQAIADYQWAWSEIDRLAGVQAIHHEKLDPDLLVTNTEVALENKTPRKLIGWIAGFPIAAVLALALWYLGWQESKIDQPRADFEPAIELMARIEQRSLEDGSKVYINRGSSVEIAYTTDERRVFLTKGEANFDVSKDPYRPFVVNVAGVDVRAVGTIFSVKLTQEDVQVIVSEGRVNVSTSPIDLHKKDSVSDSFLERGQRARVGLGTGGEPMVEVSDLSISQMEIATRWKPRLLDFESTPLREIIDEFNKCNPIQVTLGDPALETFLISSTFWSDNVEGFVRLMESTFGVNAHWGSDREIILSKGASSSEQ